ncbi:UNVERIFIED_CONTAM: AT-rich interactive domain-containing protein 5 [Sesamum angustifolium]|uniref:AT-rich interactive domain-containing protein 5 n=1 Tax=Sesamum angustifolium TaxID=2727405 RepID=A0AAW2L3G7_9LAMI
MDKPRSVHWEAALRILKYIKASPGKGLLFKRHGHVKIEAYSDADYAGAKDDRKSTSGYCTYVGGNLVTWRSKKQTTVARSSAEAEYRAMAHTTSEILWLKNLLKELGFMYDDPVPMHCDNQAAIHIASNPIFHERTKHIEGNGHQGSGSGSGRARRDAAARAMQGWHVQRLFGYGEVGEPVIKDKNLNNMAKRDKNVKAIGSLKQKRSNEVEHSVKAARTETSKQLSIGYISFGLCLSTFVAYCTFSFFYVDIDSLDVYHNKLVTSVVDVGPPADWVKINVRQAKDCFEVYALVPGLLREEVRVQSDPAGRLVITGQPEQVDNPWGITPFKKVVSLPARIDPLQTSAVVSLHGRLFVRVPLEQSNI